ncbi:MAG: neutral zinc metallopeptidase [Myxococcales bacterium]|nr:neutral zinc metallopeptidase [Myxococcales bacterium]
MRLGSEGDDLSNVEDRRGFTGGGMKLGLGGILVLGALSLIFRQNLFTAVEQPGAQPQSGPAVEQRKTAEGDLQKVAVGAFNDAQSFWRQRVRGWSDAKLVLFWDEIDSGCGGAAAAMGPFYCPLDQRVYIDLGFYQELARRFGAPGDFAQAYVIAHEVGHHVQNLLGISERVTRQQQRDPSQRNALSVRLELQADCFAGVWGHGAAQKGMLDPGDAEEGLRAAASVGDDRLQKMAGRRVAPESFTHGSAADRSRWFKRGFDSGSADACDTFQ